LLEVRVGSRVGGGGIHGDSIKRTKLILGKGANRS
jgi:hypothetical protein